MTGQGKHVLAVGPATLSLGVPPAAGAPVIPYAAQLSAKLDGKRVEPRWAYDGPIVSVTSSGKVTGRREGSAVITAIATVSAPGSASAEVRDTALVTVRNSARLHVSVQNVPDADSVAVKAFSASHTLLGSTSGTESDLQLDDVGNLSLEVTAFAPDGRLVGRGAWPAVGLFPNQTSSQSVPVFLPRWSDDATLSVVGGMTLTLPVIDLPWRNGALDWWPAASASAGGAAASVTLGVPGATVVLPTALSGSPAVRTLSLTLDGITLDRPIRMLQGLRINPAVSSIASGSHQQFTVLATDTAGVAAPAPDPITWSATFPGGWTGTAGIGYATGIFWTMSTGSSQVSAVFGTGPNRLVATASVVMR